MSADLSQRYIHPNIAVATVECDEHGSTRVVVRRQTFEGFAAEALGSHRAGLGCDCNVGQFASASGRDGYAVNVAAAINRRKYVQ